MAKDKSKYTRNDDPARFVKSEYDVLRFEYEPGGRLNDEELPAALPALGLTVPPALLARADEVIE